MHETRTGAARHADEPFLSMKTYRIYYNREKDWPQVWSVDEGSQATEINVIGVEFDGVQVTSQHLPAPLADTPRESPFAWFEVTAHLEVVGGVAYFS